MISALLLAAQGPSFHSINTHRLPASKAKFDFVALGDNRPAGAGLPPTNTFKQILRDVATIGPTFVISSGDLLFGKDETLAQYKQEVKWMRPLLNALPCPFFNAPGNHEINDRPEFYREYLKSYGATYGTFKFGQWRFVAVSTEEVGSAPGLSKREIGWLKQIFAKPEPKMVFEHHPVYGRKTNSEKESTVHDPEMVASLYRDGGVKYVFEGHDHVFNHQTHDGVEYTIAGGAGAPLDAIPQEGGYFHFCIVHVDGDSVTVDTIPLGALQVSPSPKGVVVCNYCDSDLHLRHLVVRRTKRPSSASAVCKKKAVKVKILSERKVGGSYEVVLDLKAAKHQATTVTLR